MSDQYYSAIQEQWSNIRGLYMVYGSKKPIMLYDIHEKKIYAKAYPLGSGPTMGSDKGGRFG